MINRSECKKFVAIICVAVLLCSGCNRKKESSKNGNKITNKKSNVIEEKTEVIWGGFMTDNSTSLCRLLTEEYSCEELKEFFLKCNRNDKSNVDTLLSFTQVNEKFPIEVLRKNNHSVYSVYKVKEGGYFYVFWADTAQDALGEPIVYFSAHIESVINENLFLTLKIGRSTAIDVQKIDPSFELDFLRSSGTFSYSLLNENEIMEIQYMDDWESCEHKNLIVKKMTVLKRDSTSSKFSIILSKDLPDNTG